MSEKYAAREVVRFALHYAIADREEFLDCIGDYDEDVKRTTNAKIAAMKAMLKRRYGQKTHEETLADSDVKTVSIWSLVDD